MVSLREKPGGRDGLLNPKFGGSRIMPMSVPTKLELLSQFHSLQHTGFDVMLQQHAAANNLPVEFFFAIASRETNCVNELGDFQGGEYHGIGIVQIDIQYPIALQARDSGSWKTDPSPLIEFGANLLGGCLAGIQKQLPALPADQYLKIGASSYNTGLKHALIGMQNGDSDQLTTGKNYGRDVMTRMAIFAELIAENA